MAAIFDLTLEQLRQRQSAKWQRYPADVIPAWVAEMDCVPAEPVRAALAEFATLGDTGYPLPGRYVEAFRAFAGRHWGWEVEPTHCLLSPDVMMGVLVVLLQATDPGDAVVINDPVYPPFDAFPKLLGRRVIRADLSEDGRLDLEALSAAFEEARAGGGRAAYLLCNPHNPTGVAHTGEELATLAEIAARHEVTVVSDEIHAPLVYAEASFTPYLTVPGARQAFAIHSAAKTYSLAALKAGVIVASPDQAYRLPGMVSGPNASLSGVYAHAAAWEHGDEWLTQLLAELDVNRRLVVDQLAATIPGISVRLPESTYLMWLDCRGLELDREPYDVFLEEAKVAMNPGLTFGERGRGHVRLNIATSPAVLTEIITRLAGALG